MKQRKKIQPSDAYALRTPEDSVQLYADWAETYDSDFVAGSGYVYHQRVADCLLRHLRDIEGPILDVGCGTGLVGLALRKSGATLVDGIDISAAMLKEARAKTLSDGSAVYRQLIEADMTRKISIADHHYAALISSGTFTHGHLGPEALRELWRIAAPGAVCIIGINAGHYDLMGFGEEIAAAVANGIITSPDFTEVEIYESGINDRQQDQDTALVLECRTL